VVAFRPVGRVVAAPGWVLRALDKGGAELPRLALVADLLLDPTETIASVAQKVGYRSAFALSTASA
jgi:hypothetical protein